MPEDVNDLVTMFVAIVDDLVGPILRLAVQNNGILAPLVAGLYERILGLRARQLLCTPTHPTAVKLFNRNFTD